MRTAVVVYCVSTVLETSTPLCAQHWWKKEVKLCEPARMMTM
jgi:hypothetical protein